MTQDHLPQALDIRAFAKAGACLEGADALDGYARISQDVSQDEAAADTAAVRWSARGRVVPRAGAADEIWLDLRVQARIAQVCQRCLRPVLSPVEIERSFQFVADERTAAALDEESEADVLVISRRFDLHALIEDELLMALPLVPKHEGSCPQDIAWSPEGEGFEAQVAQPERARPFAALDVLKKKLR